VRNYPSLSGLQETAGFLGGLLQQTRLAWRLLTDRRVPAWVKLIPVAALVYLLSPIDLLPDLMLPVLGELDDVAIILLALKMFVDLSPSNIVGNHMDELFGGRKRARAAGNASAGDTFIEAPYRVVAPGKE